MGFFKNFFFFALLSKAAAFTATIRNMSPETWIVTVKVDEGDMTVVAPGKSGENNWFLSPGDTMEVEYPSIGHGTFTFVDKNTNTVSYDWDRLPSNDGPIIGFKGQCTDEMNLNDPSSGFVVIYGSFFQYPIVFSV